MSNMFLGYLLLFFSVTSLCCSALKREDIMCTWSGNLCNGNLFFSSVLHACACGEHVSSRFVWQFQLQALP